MSTKERRRLAVLGQVAAGQLSVAAAGRLLGLSERQARRVWRCYRQEGDAGLVHRLRGRPGNRRGAAALRAQALELCRRHYGDFGPTLAAEYLAQRHGLEVDDQTLRRWLSAEGLWRRCRRETPRRRRRPRKACGGELVQLDGSEHDWFEGRAGEALRACCLMVMIDDATGQTHARFFAAQTTEAAMTVLRDWALAHGLPRALYPDRHGIYRRNDKQADRIEARTGQRPPTQLGRALAELGVELIWAGSPQAKGRVERMNGTLQDRLVKALRVEGIGDLASANAYLERTFLPALNARFAVAAAEAADLHTPVTAAALESALCIRQERVVGQDQCVSWEGRVLQLAPPRGMASLAGKRVQVRRLLDGQVQVWLGDTRVPHTPVAQRARAAAPRPSLRERVSAHQPARKPAGDHPWRAPAVDRRPSGGGRCAAARAAPSPALRGPRPTR